MGRSRLDSGETPGKAGSSIGALAKNVPIRCLKNWRAGYALGLEFTRGALKEAQRAFPKAFVWGSVDGLKQGPFLKSPWPGLFVYTKGAFFPETRGDIGVFFPIKSVGVIHIVTAVSGVWRNTSGLGFKGKRVGLMSPIFWAHFGRGGFSRVLTPRGVIKEV